MTNDHATALVLRWRELADALARDELVRGHQALVALWVSRHAVTRRHRDDATQEANLGLLRAIDTYAADRGAKFVTWASIQIRGTLQRFVLKVLGETSGGRAVRAARRQLERDGLHVTHDAIAEATGLCAEDVAATLSTPRHVSLDAVVDDNATLHERLADGGVAADEALDTARARARLRQSIDRAMRLLSVDERLVARERWMTEEPATLREVGALLGCSHESARQIEMRALERVAAVLRARGIGEWEAA